MYKGVLKLTTWRMLLQGKSLVEIVMAKSSYALPYRRGIG